MLASRCVQLQQVTSTSTKVFRRGQSKPARNLRQPIQNPQELEPPDRVREAGRRPRRQSPGAVGRCRSSPPRGRRPPPSNVRPVSNATSSNVLAGATSRRKEHESVDASATTEFGDAGAHAPRGRRWPARARRATEHRSLTETPSRSTPAPPALREKRRTPEQTHRRPGAGGGTKAASDPPKTYPTCVPQALHASRRASRPPHRCWKPAAPRASSRRFSGATRPRRRAGPSSARRSVLPREEL